jgi:hypothetical protein
MPRKPKLTKPQPSFRLVVNSRKIELEITDDFNASHRAQVKKWFTEEFDKWLYKAAYLDKEAKK